MMEKSETPHLSERVLPNPFSVKPTTERPRYVRHMTLDVSQITGNDNLRIRYLPPESFDSHEERLEYGRNVIIQIVRDWIQPRLNHWSHRMSDPELRAAIDRVMYAEIVMYTLWHVQLVLNELMNIFFTEEDHSTREGRAFKMEIRARLLPCTTVSHLHVVVTQTLELAYSLARNEIVTRRSPVSCFSVHYIEHGNSEDVYRHQAYWSDSDDDSDSDPFGSEESLRMERLHKLMPALLTRLKYFYIDLNDGFYLNGLSHTPVHAIVQKKGRRIIKDATADIVSDLMQYTNQDHVFLQDMLKWYTVSSNLWPLSHTMDYRLDTVDDMDTADDKNKANRYAFFDVKTLLDKMYIDEMTEKIYSATITLWPRSKTAVDILNRCLDRHNPYGRDNLVSTLIREIKTNLLNVGTTTSCILQAYANAVDSLRTLDPSCVIMHKVCRVIKEYIKKRSDTVRQIITYITTERKDDFKLNDRERKGAVVVDDGDVCGVNDEFLPGGGGNYLNSFWRNWQPDPPDAQPGESSRFRQSADVFNMLVSVYGSKEMFVKEYRQLLAERLGNPITKDVEFERRYLDLLKLRFSEGELQQCEVMLRDVGDSLETDRIAEIANDCPLIVGRVISAHFWPQFEREHGVDKLPDEVEKCMAAYEKHFEKYKDNRRLEWIRAYGLTELTLTLDGITVDKIVPNIMAAVIYAFLEKEEWEIGEISEKLAVPKTIAKRRLEWWEVQGVLTQYVPAGATSEAYRLTRNASNMHRFRSNVDGEEEEEDVEEEVDPISAVDSLEQYWKYTKSYIANQENNEIKAERLLSIYRMFASPSSQQISLDTVIAFLTRKVKLGLLICNNNMYKVVKDASAK